jgi:PAS domain S-box-containing protein
MQISWVNNLPLSRKGMLLIAVAFSVQVLVILFYSLIVNRSDAMNVQQHHHKELIGRVNWLSTLIVTSSLSSVAHAVTGDNEYGEVFEQSKKAADAEFKLMAPLVKDDAVEWQGLNDLAQRWPKLESLLERCANASPDNLKGIVASGEMKTLWRELFRVRHIILKEEATSFPVSIADLESSRGLLKSLLNVVVVLDFVMAIAVFYIFSQQIVKRIGTIADNSARLVGGVALNQPLSGRDEIQQLDSSFHKMAAQLTAARNELQASENRVRSILDNVPTGVLVVCADWKIEFGNGAVVSLFGHLADDLKDMNVADLFVAERGNASFEQILRDSRKAVVELTAKKGDGNTFRAEISTNVIEVLDGERMLVAVKDVTERYELECMKREFVSMVCHDLRNPLSSLQLFHEMLASGYIGGLTGSGPKLLTNAQRCTENLLTLTNDMLELDRLDYSSGGSADLVRSRLTLDRIIDQAIGSVEGSLTSKQIAINYAPTDLELEVDELKILRVMTNLLNNAVKFSPEKSTIKIAVVEKHGQATISVTDEGRGIPASMHEAIFDKFKQVSLKDARRGSGLGLAICKKFVESHNGTIGVSSEPGQGSTFWFTLAVLVPARR